MSNTQSSKAGERTQGQLFRIESNIPCGGRHEVHTLKEWKRIYGYEQGHPFIRLIQTHGTAAVNTEPTTQNTRTGQKEPKIEAQHTPGPWFVQQTSNGWGINAKGQSLFLPSGPDDAEGEANARLAAGAPELLDACRAALTHMTALSNDPVNWPIAAHSLKAAISNAEGK